MKKLLLISFLFLSACGFSSLYQEVTTEEKSVPVWVEPIPNQYGFTMRQIIQNKFRNPKDSKYILTVSAPTFTSWDQTIDNKNFATLMGTSGTVKYRLTEKSTKKVLLVSSDSLSTSYSVVQDPYATTTAQKKASQELVERLADQVSLRVLAALAGVHNEGKTISN